MGENMTIASKYTYPLRVRRINNGYIVKHWDYTGENEVYLKNKDELTAWINAFYPKDD